MFNLYQRPGGGGCPVAHSGQVGVQPPCSNPSACPTHHNAGGGGGAGGGAYSDAGGGGGYASTTGSSSEGACPGQSFRPCARGKMRTRRPDFFVQVPADKEDTNVPARDVALYKLSKAAGNGNRADPYKATGPGGYRRGATGNDSLASEQGAPPCEQPSPDSYVLRIKRRCGAGCEEQEQLELELKAPPPPPKKAGETQVADTDLPAAPPKKGGKGKKGKKK